MKYRVVVSMPHKINMYEVNEIDKAIDKMHELRDEILNNYPELEDLLSVWIEELRWIKVST